MKFIDEANILVRAGDGAKGALSFRRENTFPVEGQTAVMVMVVLST